MQADFDLDYDVVTLERPQTLYLMARFESGPAPQDRQRRPLNLSLVIDKSGSMAGDKIDYTRQAAQFLVHHLGADDFLSIVLYNDKADTLLMPEKVRRKDVIAQRIDHIKAGGTTNLSSGWLEGCKLVADNLDEHAINRVILMSDGLVNQGVTNSTQIVAMTRQKFEEGVSTTTMGLGQDFNEDLLMAMAHAGGGAYYFIESPEVAPVIFQEELQGLLNVVGQNLTISITPTDHVRSIKQLNAYPTHTDGIAHTFRLGDIFGSEVKTLMIELFVPALDTLGETQIATLRFEYDELLESGTKHHVVERAVRVNVAEQSDQPLLSNVQVQKAVLLLKAAQARREAVSAADSGAFDAAAQALRQVAEAIRESGIDSQELRDEQAALLQQADDMEKGAAHYDSYSRKVMSTEALYTMTSRHADTVVMRAREQQRSTQSVPAIYVEDDQVIARREGEAPTHVTWKDHTYLLEGSLIRIGRSHHNEIIIAAKGVSRFHCQIVRKESEFFLEDLGSTNGTLILGKVITGLHPLSVGDVAYLCDQKLVFHDGSLT